MNTILLGKDGNQPFQIKNEGVSHQHAQITIDDFDQWTLEDLDSSNGTYTRRESDGELLRVSKVKITPMTFICLGPDNSKGCSFYARQVLDYGNFKEEYEYLNDKEDEFDDKILSIEHKAQMIKKIIFFVNIAIVLFSLVGETGVWLLRAGTIVSTFFAAFYDAGGAKKKVNDLREKFHQCPNPLCSHRLKTDEIRDMKCAKCKK
jgi:hypothetical protein